MRNHITSLEIKKYMKQNSQDKIIKKKQQRSRMIFI